MLGGEAIWLGMCGYARKKKKKGAHAGTSSSCANITNTSALTVLA